MRFALRLHTSRDLIYTAAHQSSRLEQKTIGMNRHGTEEALISHIVCSHVSRPDGLGIRDDELSQSAVVPCPPP